MILTTEDKMLIKALTQKKGDRVTHCWIS